ncbi:MAG: protein phosphatase 2C domain-containing protein [Chloroflexi bacterium]|nr:protein phosphatase 2C domain-containing protein [Chloroflexota bacterium]
MQRPSLCACGELRPMKPLVLDGSAATCCGDVRTVNQDVLRLCGCGREPAERLGRLYALADGMGGYEDGEIAARIAVDSLFQTYYDDSFMGAGSGRLRQAFECANLAVYQAREARGMRMGTTLTALLVIGHKLTIGHIGDCRAYLVRGGSVRCLTNDHTPVGEMVRYGVLTPDKVRGHVQRSLLNRCLGLELFARPDISQADLHDADWLVLCSDGVWSVIEDDEFAGLCSGGIAPAELSEHLIACAGERGSDDNMSVLALRVSDDADKHAHDFTRTMSLARLFRR